MSRSFAAIASTLVRAVTLPLSARQRQRTIARHLNRLEQDSLTRIDCPRGSLRLHTLRSAHCASAVARFFTDEPETLAWIDTFADGACFLDVGANIGIYALYAALNPALQVVAVEPNGINFGLLIEHAALNQVDERLIALAIALGARTTLAPLHLRQLTAGAGGAELGTASTGKHAGEISFTQTVLSFALDDLVRDHGIPAPRYIKLDVDGTEQDILTGARHTLTGVESLLMEVERRSPEAIERDLEGPLRELGFFEDEAVRARGSGRNRLYINTADVPELISRS